MKEPTKTFGQMVKAIRLQTKMNGVAFAAMIGVAPSTLCNIEGDKHRTLAPTVDRIAQATGANSDILFAALVSSERHTQKRVMLPIKEITMRVYELSPDQQAELLKIIEGMLAKGEGKR